MTQTFSLRLEFAERGNEAREGADGEGRAIEAQQPSR